MKTYIKYDIIFEIFKLKGGQALKKRVTIGILAHVDAGKTTLSEALLYAPGRIRTLGRVDHKNTYLDTNVIERERGITIIFKAGKILQ